MYKYCDINDKFISLHDCRVTKVSYDKGILTFIFAVTASAIYFNIPENIAQLIDGNAEMVYPLENADTTADGYALLETDLAKELESFGYLKRTQQRDAKGIIKGYEYDIYEYPYTKNPYMENQYMENPYMENQAQLNTNILNTKELNTKEYKRFKKPTLEDIKQYCLERNNNIDCNKFFDYYEANGWVQGKTRKPIKDWKACIRTWERTEVKQDKPTWFKEDIQREEMTQEEIDSLRKELNL